MCSPNGWTMRWAAIRPSSTSAAAAMFRGIELRASGGALAAGVVRECMARDLWIYPAGSGVPPVTDAVMIGAPLTISEPEVIELVDRLAAAIDAAAAHA